LAQPRLLLPLALLDHLNPAQRTALLLHELIHIKRGDHLVRTLELVVGVVFWWLPVGRLVGRQLPRLRRDVLRCNGGTHLPRERREYARLLLNVLDFVNPLPEETRSTGDRHECRL